MRGCTIAAPTPERAMFNGPRHARKPTARSQGLIVESARGVEISWRIKGFYRPAYYVLGAGGLFRVLALSFVLLTPGLSFGFYCVWSAQYTALV